MFTILVRKLLNARENITQDISTSSEGPLLNLAILLLSKESFMQAILASQTLYEDLEMLYSSC